jgi:hypothetical protein
MPKWSKLLVVAIFGATMILSTQAQAQAQARNLSGSWRLQDQGVSEGAYTAELKQNGSGITGTYTRDGNVSTIQGTVEKGVVKLFWKQPHNGRSGEAHLYIQDHGRTLSGPWWYHGQRIDNKRQDGTWTFTRTP